METIMKLLLRGRHSLCILLLLLCDDIKMFSPIIVYNEDSSVLKDSALTTSLGR